MEPTAPRDLSERVTRLEAQVSWLLQRQQTTQSPAASSPRPMVPPTRPRKGLSPVVWIAGIGASIFLLGTSFFFRWAIQQGWLAAEFRFAMGLLVGGAIATLAVKLILQGGHRLGSALLFAGLGTLQFTFRVGAIDYQFYAASVGLATTASLTLMAGALAARTSSSGALTVALLSALAAPILFSQGGHHEVALALYLAVLLAAALAVPYLARTGEAWHGARWTALVGVWLLLLSTCAEVSKADTSTLAALLAVHLLLAGLWAWLPGTKGLPSTPSALWLVASILATAYGWLLWRRAGVAPGGFALPMVAVALLNLALIHPLRRRLGCRQADWGLLALAAGHLALAVPVALAWRWVGPLWGVFALGLVWASLKAEARGFPAEAKTLRWLAAGLALLTTLRWATHASEGLYFLGAPPMPFLNPSFAEGALATAAWLLLAKPQQLDPPSSAAASRLQFLSFLMLEVIANGTAALEAARLVQWFQASPLSGHGLSRAASIAMTLVWTLSGAWQWMRGLGQRNERSRALLIAGYVWMGVAGVKLLASDLDRADTPLRALAFLGVGGIGMAAAVFAHYRGKAAGP